MEEFINKLEEELVFDNENGTGLKGIIYKYFRKI